MRPDLTPDPVTPERLTGVDDTDNIPVPTENSVLVATVAGAGGTLLANDVRLRRFRSDLKRCAQSRAALQLEVLALRSATECLAR